MSKQYSTVAHEISYIVSQVNQLSEDEVRDVYGIELLPNGMVFDPTYNREFFSVGDWAEFSAEQDAVEYKEHFYGKDYED